MLQISEKVGANIEDISKIMGLDSRIGHQFLKSGSGFGGPCFKKDVAGLAKIEEQYGIENGFAKLTNEFNEKHKEIYPSFGSVPLRNRFRICTDQDHYR